MAANMAGFWQLLLVPLLFLLPGCSSEVCAPINYDIDPLKFVNMWWFETDNFTDCNPFNTSGSTCVVFFSVCHQVPTLCPINSGICVVNRVTIGSKLKNATFYSWPTKISSFNGFKFISEKNSFTLKLPSESPQKYSTSITFKCKENVAWKISSESLHGAQVPEAPSISFDLLLNQYSIEFNASLACEKGGGGGGGGDTDDARPLLSVGSIILILFFPGLFLYFVVGILINRGAGKTGKEMIPHSKFWMSLPGLIMDGFSFCIAKLTCSEMSSSKQNYNQM